MAAFRAWDDNGHKDYQADYRAAHDDRAGRIDRRDLARLRRRQGRRGRSMPTRKISASRSSI